MTYQNTLELCRLIPSTHIKTYKYEFQPDWNTKLAKLAAAPRFDKTHVTVLAIDTFVAAQLLPGKVACLNFADDSFPTGCASTGSGAQEESLCYRSTLSKHIDIKHYPLMGNALLYSAGVVVFKEPEEANFQVMSEPFTVDVISCPGVRHPCLDSGTGRMKPEDIDTLIKKIETIFQVAHSEKVDHLVLGALGCGAWKNPPEDVASAFKGVIDRHPGMFASIVFAIKPASQSHTRWQDQRNLEVFKTCLAHVC